MMMIKIASIKHEMDEENVPLDWNFDETEDEHMDFVVDDVLYEDLDFHELNENKQWSIERDESSNMRANKQNGMGNSEREDEGGFSNYYAQLSCH